MGMFFVIHVITIAPPDIASTDAENKPRSAQLPPISRGAIRSYRLRFLKQNIMNIVRTVACAIPSTALAKEAGCRLTQEGAFDITTRRDAVREALLAAQSRYKSPIRSLRR